MKLENKSTRAYIAYDVVLKAGEILEVDNAKAIELLLKQPDIHKCIDEAENKKLAEENKKLKQELAKNAKKAEENKKK